MWTICHMQQVLEPILYGYLIWHGSRVDPGVDSSYWSAQQAVRTTCPRQSLRPRTKFADECEVVEAPCILVIVTEEQWSFVWFTNELVVVINSPGSYVLIGPVVTTKAHSIPTWCEKTLCNQTLDEALSQVWGTVVFVPINRLSWWLGIASSFMWYFKRARISRTDASDDDVSVGI